MEIRKFSVCLAFLLVAAFSQCSDARHSLERRETNYEDFMIADGTSENEPNEDPSEGPSRNATILSKPQTYEVTIGRNVKLECLTDANASELADTVVDWTKNDDNIIVADYVINSAKYSFNASASKDLIIKSLDLNDSGIYKCKLVQGLPMKVEHSLVVLEAPMVVNITASDNGRPREGDDLLVTCNVVGTPPPEIHWSVVESGKTGNRKLTEKDGTFTRNSVFIENVKVENSGTYYCYAINSLASDQKMIAVFVQGKPRVHVHRTVVNSAVNVEATLQCSVHEITPATITWYKDDNPITSASKTTITMTGLQSNLTVIPESDADFGTYTCRATSEGGVHSRSIELVQRPVVEELDSDGPKLIWKVHSHQKLEEIEVQIRELNGDGVWKSFNVPVPDTQTHEYELSYMINAPELKAGSYEAVVRVRNAKDTSRDTDSTILSIVNEQASIMGASVYRGNNAPMNRPATVLLSTIMMYLLVRML